MAMCQLRNACDLTPSHTYRLLRVKIQRMIWKNEDGHFTITRSLHETPPQDHPRAKEERAEANGQRAAQERVTQDQARKDPPRHGAVKEQRPTRPHERTRRPPRHGAVKEQRPSKPQERARETPRHGAVKEPRPTTP